MPESRTVSATAELCGYVRVGDGPLRVIVLHGWLTDAASWAPFQESADTASYSWCFMDARGYGLSRARSGEFTTEELARDAIAIADALGWDEFSLVGHSMSGLAIQRGLLAAPGRVHKVVGVSPVPACGGGLGERRALFDLAVTDPKARATIIDFSTGNRRSPQWVHELTQRSFACSNAVAVRGYLNSWAVDDIRDRIIGTPTSVGVVVGEHDPSLSPRRMADTWLAWYPDARMEILEDAGHYPMQEQPAALARAVDRLLGRNPAGTV